MMMLGADVNLEESFLWHFESDSRFFLGHNTKAQMFHTYMYICGISYQKSGGSYRSKL